jgi:hypothetical protein
MHASKGFLCVDDFFKYAKVEKNKLGMYIFDVLQSIEGGQYIDFGEFSKALSTYCMMR